MSRRNNRKNPYKTPPSQRKGNGHERTDPFTEPPEQPDWTDTSRVWIGAGPDQPPPKDEGDGTAKAGFGSRGNRLASGLRSRLLFPEAMQQLIDERSLAFAVQVRPRTLLEWWLVTQIARGTVQSDLAADQLLINISLALGRVETRWADDRREQAEKLGQRLAKSPARIARELGRTKYGALYLIDQLTSLGESIASNGGLCDEQRDCLMDVLGVAPVFRNGCRKVPAGSDGPGLAAVVEQEKARLSTKLERELNVRDQQEQDAARLGIVKRDDLETRKLNNYQGRADRRVKWAWQVLGEVRAGVDPATIIDCETGKPINPEAHASPAPEAVPPAPEPPPPTPPPPTSPASEPPPSAYPMPPIPEGYSGEEREILLLVGEAFLRSQAPSGAEELLADEPSGEPGPPSA